MNLTSYIGVFFTYEEQKNQTSKYVLYLKVILL